MNLNVVSVVCLIWCLICALTFAFDPSLCKNITTRLKMIDRREPIPWKTYFGSEALLQSNSSEMEHYKAMFTIPKHAAYIHITDSKDQIMSKWKNSAKRAIVLNATTTPFNPFPATTFEQILEYGSLEELWIESKWIDSNVNPFNLCNSTSNSSAIKAMQRLKILHIITHSSRRSAPDQLINVNPMPCIYFAESLELLNIKAASYAMLANAYISFTEVMRSVKTKSNLQVLSFHGVEDRDTYPYKPNMSLTFSLTNHLESVEYLSVSDSPNVIILNPNVISLFPCLKGLDLSYDYDGYDSSMEKWTALALNKLLHFHSTIRFLAVEDHSAISAYSSMSPEVLGVNQYNREHYSKCKKLIDSTFSSQMQCNWLKCFFLDNTLSCSHAPYFVNDNNCLGGVRFPMSPELEEIYLPHSRLSLVLYLFYKHLWISQWANITQNQSNATQMCFQSNKFDVVDLSSTNIVSYFSDNVSPFLFSHYVPTSFYNGYRPFGSLQLTKLNISDIGLSSVVSEYVFDASFLPNIKILDMSRNTVSFNPHLKICTELNTLEWLDLSHNAISTIPEQLFSNCKQLTNVSLAQNALSTLPDNLFLNSKRLKHVDLSNNRFYNLPENLFSSCKELEFVDLSSNQLLTIPMQMHAEFERMDTYIDLINNPLTCNCDANAIETIRQVTENSHRFKNSELYLCRNLKDIQIQSSFDIDNHVEKCQENLLLKVVGITVGTCVSIFLTGILIFLLYKYRYRVITCLYRTRQCFSEPRYGPTNIFDLYLIYCREDREWVHNLLRPILEDVHGLNCCIHYRDFPLVGDVDEVICKYMRHSKDILAVISNDSITKRWPKFELQFAQELEREAHKRIFYVVLGNLGMELPDRIRRVLDAKIFIQFPDLEKQELVTRFFQRLVATIYGHEICGIYPSCLKTREVITPQNDDITQQISLQLLRNPTHSTIEPDSGISSTSCSRGDNNSSSTNYCRSDSNSSHSCSRGAHSSHKRDGSSSYRHDRGDYRHDRGGESSADAEVVIHNPHYGSSQNESLISVDDNTCTVSFNCDPSERSSLFE